MHRARATTIRPIRSLAGPCEPSARYDFHSWLRRYHLGYGPFFFKNPAKNACGRAPRVRRVRRAGPHRRVLMQRRARWCRTRGKTWRTRFCAWCISSSGQTGRYRSAGKSRSRYFSDPQRARSPGTRPWKAGSARCRSSIHHGAARWATVLCVFVFQGSGSMTGSPGDRPAPSPQCRRCSARSRRSWAGINRLIGDKTSFEHRRNYGVLGVLLRQTVPFAYRNGAWIDVVYVYGLTFDMSGSRKQAKLAGGRPLDGVVR